MHELKYKGRIDGLVVASWNNNVYLVSEKRIMIPNDFDRRGLGDAYIEGLQPYDTITVTEISAAFEKKHIQTLLEMFKDE